MGWLRHWLSDAALPIKAIGSRCPTAALLLSLTTGPVSLSALTVVNYDAAAHARFSSGFPTAPVDNTDPGFVGAGQDFSGVAWSTTTYVSNTFKGFAMLSPQHFLSAQHYETSSNGLRTQGVRIKDKQGLVQRVDGVTSVTGLGYGLFLRAANGQEDYDLGIGTLSTTLAAQNDFSRLAALDLHESSGINSLSNYGALTFFLYGHGGSTNGSPRLALTSPDFVSAVNNDVKQTIIQTSHNEAVLIGGDSGYPALHAWSNPNGGSELTVLGVNSAVDTTNGRNFISFLPSVGGIAAAQSVMNPDGFALRLVGNPAYTWSGSASTRIDRNVAWGLGGNPNSSGATNDRYVLFDPASAVSFSPSMEANYNLRGLYFKSSAANGDGFNFTGSSTLTIGRGGLTNYDENTQSFAHPLALGAPQYWTVAAGALQVTNLQTNGHLLEIGGAGTTTFSGAIAGSGSLALSGGSLVLNGTHSYTGTTWVHAGTLQVDGQVESSSAFRLGPFATLSGTGRIAPVSGSGEIAPGNGPGILTSPSIEASAGLQIDFEFTQVDSPSFNQPAASLNDVLRLTAATPFVNPLTPANRIRIFLDVDPLSKDQALSGGFFTDSADDFLAMIEEAEVLFFIADEGGSVTHGQTTYRAYTEGPLQFALSTVPQTADFGSGNVDGRLMQIQTSANPANYEGWKLLFDLSGDAALDDADDDADDVPLLLEYALGGDPTAHDTGLAPESRLTLSGSETFLELHLTRPQAPGDLTYLPQTTTDLKTWPPDATGIADPAPVPIDHGDGTETLIYRRAEAVDAASNAFMRVVIDRNAP